MLLPEWGGSKVTLHGGEEFYIYRDDDIVGILSEKVPPTAPRENMRLFRPTSLSRSNNVFKSRQRP